MAVASTLRNLNAFGGCELNRPQRGSATMASHSLTASVPNSMAAALSQFSSAFHRTRRRRSNPTKIPISTSTMIAGAARAHVSSPALTRSVTT